MARDHEILRHLIPVDRALASADGAAVRELARELGVSQKTIRRDLDRLHKISPLVYWEAAASLGQGGFPSSDVLVIRSAYRNRSRRCPWGPLWARSRRGDVGGGTPAGGLAPLGCRAWLSYR